MRNYNITYNDSYLVNLRHLNVKFEHWPRTNTILIFVFRAFDSKPYLGHISNTILYRVAYNCVLACLYQWFV